jgi:hypothetical protein
MLGPADGQLGHATVRVLERGLRAGERVAHYLAKLLQGVGVQRKEDHAQKQHRLLYRPRKNGMIP